MAVIQAGASVGESAERLLSALEQYDQELYKLYAALVATGQRDVVELLRRNEQLLSSPFYA